MRKKELICNNKKNSSICPEELRTRTEEVGLKVVSIKHTKRSHKWLVGIFRK
jgi:hypothetical protein